jgi:hypothetical protein
MLKKSALVFVVLLLGAIVFVQGRASTLAADLFQSPLPTPRAAALDEVTLESLLERIEGLEARVSELEEVQADGAQAFRVYVATYLLDEAGLHDLDVRLNEEGEILPDDRGQVLRVARLLAILDWPEEVAEDADTLIDLMYELAEALGDDDLESAAPLATEVHDRQHDLSHAVEDWLNETEHGHDRGGEHPHGHGEDEDEDKEEDDGHGHGHG